MITKQGGCIDARHRTVWVRLEYDSKREKTTVEIHTRKGGKRLATNGIIGQHAKTYYDKLNTYFFRHE